MEDFYCETCGSLVRWLGREKKGERILLRGACECPGAAWVSAEDEPRPHLTLLVADAGPRGRSS